MATQTTNRRINLYINGKEVRNNIKGIAAEYKRSKNELAKLTRGTEEYNRKAAEVRKLKGMLDEHNQQIRKTQSSWQKAKSTIKGLLPAFGFAAIIGGTARLIQKWTQWRNQLEKTRHEIHQLTDATGAQLEHITAKVQATAKTFNKNTKEITKTANSLSKQMGISFDNAVELMQDGLITGADISGEFMKMLQEYPAQLEEVGLSASQAVAMMSQQVKEGVFSDKGIDAIKEANIRIREMTDSTAEAIDNIGLNSQEIRRQLVSGEKSMFQIIQMISAQLNKLPDQSQKVGTAIADIFGGPGEDAGLRYLKTLEDVNTNLNEIKKDTDSYSKAQERLVDASEDLNKSFNAMFGEGSWWNRMKAGFKEFFASTFEGLRRIPFLMNQIFQTKPITEFQDVILNTSSAIKKNGKSIKQLAQDVREYGTETDKGKEALTQLNSVLVEMYGSEGLEIAQNFTEEQKKLARQRSESHEEEAEAAEEKKDKVSDAEKELAKRIEEIRQELRLADMTEQAREIARVDRKYDKLLKKAEGFEEKKKQLIKLKEQEIQNIREKYGTDIEAPEESLEKIKNAVIGIRDESAEANKSVKELDMNGIQQVIQSTNELQAKFQEKDIFGMTPEDWKQIQEEFRKIDAAAWELGATLSNVAEIQKNQNEKELAEYRQTQEQKKQALERRLDAGMISEKEYNQQVEQMDKKLQEQKKKMAREEAKRQKQINTFQAIIDTAAAIVGYLANPSGIAGLVLSGMAAATGATQIAAIQSQPIPQMAEGGRVKKNQVVEVAEGDKEEGILSNKTLTDPQTGPMANYLLDKQAGMSTSVPDAGAIDQAMDFNNFKRAGGSFGQSQGNTNHYVTYNYNNESSREMADDLKELKGYMKDPNNRRAVISNDIMKENDEEKRLADEINKF